MSVLDRCPAFLVETVDQSTPVPGAGTASARRSFTAVELPAGLSHISTAPGAGAIAECGATEVVAGLPRSANGNTMGWEALALLETVQSGDGFRIVLVGARGVRVRVNGIAAAPVVELRLGDRVDLADGTVLHVSEHHRPYVGPPPPELLACDRPPECPVCRVPLDASTRVYLCPRCGTATHCEDEEKPESDRLECVRLSGECSVCQTPVVMDETYLYVPEA